MIKVAGNEIRCAIVGLGRIGSLLEGDRLREKPCTHAGAVARNRECLLVGGCDLDPERRRLFAKRWRCPQIYADLEKMLAETHPHILHVATPPETHGELVERALPFGLKVIVCEKPLAENSRRAGRIAEIHRAGGITILTNHERRYSKDYLMVKTHLTGGTFGELRSIYARLYMGRQASVEEILLHDGTHLIDILRFLLEANLEKGTVARSGAPGGETLVIVSRAKHTPLILEIGSGRDQIVFELDMSFQGGRIRIGNGLYEEYESRQSPYYERMNSLKKTRRSRPRITGYFSNMLEDAVRCARDPTRMPRSSALDGYEALRFIEEVNQEQGSRWL